MRTRLLALDIDGTLLDPYGALTDAVREAVAAARHAGLEIVLCTGRRFRTALTIAQALELTGPIVVNNGALVKDIASGRTLHHRYLSMEVYPEVLALARSVGPPLVYVDTYPETADFLTERSEHAHPFQREYLRDHGAHCRVVADLASESRADVIMTSLMADAASLDALRVRAQAALGPRIHAHMLQNKNYQGEILEFLSPASGKWAALAQVATQAGIASDAIAAIGDDANDVEMLSRAGFGIAMGNAVDAAKAAAGFVARSNAEGGAVEAIERVLLGL
jgi:Cof subfamily protein (haloacid dehalogenase superfamily)